MLGDRGLRGDGCVAWSAGATRERAAYKLVAATDRAWPYRKDVEHFDALPVRSPGLLFAGLACGRREYVDLWQTMDPDPRDAEIIRNYPVRQPLLWVCVRRDARDRARSVLPATPERIIGGRNQIVQSSLDYTLGKKHNVVVNRAGAMTPLESVSLIWWTIIHDAREIRAWRRGHEI